MSQRFLRLSSFFVVVHLFELFFLPGVLIECFFLPCVSNRWFDIQVHPLNCWFPVIFSLYHLMQPSFQPGSFLCHWSMHWVPRESWQPVFWTVHLRGCLFPFHLVIFLEFCSVLSFGPYFFVSLFWKPPYVCFCVLGIAALTPCLTTSVKLYGWKS